MLLINHIWSIFQDYFPNIVKLIQVKRSSIELVVIPNRIVPILKVLKRWSNTQFNMLIDIVVIDFLNVQKTRYRIIYILENYKSGLRCLVNTSIANSLQSLMSISHIFKNANWSEREAYDLFGLQFNNHPRLTRILTDYGFIGHPLRKDFPLIGPINGKTVVRKAETIWVLRGLVDPEDER